VLTRDATPYGPDSRPLPASMNWPVGSPTKTSGLSAEQLSIPRPKQTIDTSQCRDMTDPPGTATAGRLIGPTQSSTVMPSATASAM
jgi:hypothetical protein